MSGSFYYTKNGSQFGPASEEEIRRLVGSGAVGGQDLLWTEGMASWQPIGASQFAGFLPALAQGMPVTGRPGGSPLSPGTVIAICLGCVVLLGAVVGLASHHRRQSEMVSSQDTAVANPQSAMSSQTAQEDQQPDPAASRLANAQAELLEQERRREEAREKERQERLEEEQKAARQVEEELEEIRGNYVGLVNGQSAFVRIRTSDDGSILVTEPFTGSTARLSRNGRGNYSNSAVQCQFSNGTMTLFANGVSAIFVKN